MARKWTEFVIGIIMMVSPWVLGFSDISLAKWCNVLLGLVVALISVWELFGEAPARQQPVQQILEPKRRSSKTNVEPK